MVDGNASMMQEERDQELVIVEGDNGDTSDEVNDHPNVEMQCLNKVLAIGNREAPTETGDGAAVVQAMKKTLGRSCANASASIDVHEDPGHGPSNAHRKRPRTMGRGSGNVAGPRPVQAKKSRIMGRGSENVGASSGSGHGIDDACQTNKLRATSQSGNEGGDAAKETAPTVPGQSGVAAPPKTPTTKNCPCLRKMQEYGCDEKNASFSVSICCKAGNISKCLTKTDMKCGIYALLNTVADDEDVLFAHDSVEIAKKHMYTLSKNNFISVGVVDAWCVMLNHSERSRSDESPARFFPSTFVCTDALVQTGLTDSMRRDSFFENMSIELEANKHVDLKVIDIFVFPVCKDKKFFAICADMRTGKIIVLDSMNVVATDCREDKYGKILINLRHILSDYLAFGDQSTKGESLKKGNIEIPVIEWGDKKDSVDSGVYLMRHMETFVGDLPAWSPGITARTAKQMITMRIRYCTEIMSWQHNLVRESVMKKAQIRYDEVCADPTIKVETLLFG